MGGHSPVSRSGVQSAQWLFHPVLSRLGPALCPLHSTQMTNYPVLRILEAWREAQAGDDSHRTEPQRAVPTLPGGLQPPTGALERNPLCGEVLRGPLSHKVTSVPQLTQGWGRKSLAFKTVGGSHPCRWLLRGAQARPSSPWVRASPLRHRQGPGHTLRTVPGKVGEHKASLPPSSFPGGGVRIGSLMLF